VTRFLHVANGTCTTQLIQAAGIPGVASIWADPLHDGPVPGGLTDEELLDVRRRYHAEPADPTAAAWVGRDPSLDPANDMRQWRAAIERRDAYDELILWFEHDLFDQLNLLWLVDRLQCARVSMDRVRLIVIGEFPGVDPFHGLGQLTAPELASLFPARVPATEGQLSYAADAWAAVCAPTPDGMAALADQTSAPLPFVPAAIRRLLEELPGRLDGLSRTERQGLGAFATGATTLEEAFQVQSLQEPAIFLGDLPFFRAMRGLADAEVPLLTIEGNRVALTAEGVLVLAGDADHAALNGLDRWVGGTHVTGRTPRWRWDPERGQIAISP
jgi:hypothetical protein